MGARELNISFVSSLKNKKWKTGCCSFPNNGGSTIRFAFGWMTNEVITINKLFEYFVSSPTCLLFWLPQGFYVQGKWNDIQKIILVIMFAHVIDQNKIV